MSAGGMSITAPMRCRNIELSLIDGILDGPDVDRVYHVVSESDLAIIGREESSRESLRFQLSSRHAVKEESRIVEDEEGQPIGVLMVECDIAGRVVLADTYCLPGFDATVLAPLVAMGVTAGRRLSVGSAGWQLEAGVLAKDVAAISILETCGYRHARRFWQMGIDLAGHSLFDPEPPPGVMRTVVVGERDRRLLHSIHESAFVDHFGSVARPYEQWLNGNPVRQDAAPDLWWLAWLDGAPVAEITQDYSRDAVNAAYVRTLGVAPNARGMGIGRWLLECAFADAARRGREVACLTVDSDNTTGALALYETAGMAPEVVIDLFRQPLDAIA